MPEAPFPGVAIHYPGGDYAVLDAGAQVTAWTPRDENPVLWMSPLASFEPGSAVRGGVPVVFPWFGAGTTGDRTPPHGFARTAVWRRVELVDEPGPAGRLDVRYALDATGLDSAPFAAELLASFAPTQLVVSLTVTNTGTDPFTYEEALHTYLAVGDAGRVAVEGMDGCSYLDRAEGAGSDEPVQDGDVRFDGEVDRVFRHTGAAVVVDPDFGRRIVVDKQGSANTVVWNPGAAKGSALADVGPNWAAFVCVEAGNVRDAAIELAPGASHTLSQSLRLG